MSTPWYLSCCAARSHLLLSVSHLLEPPPARSVASSPVGPGTFACRLAGEREGARPPYGPWSRHQSGTPEGGVPSVLQACMPCPASTSLRRVVWSFSARKSMSREVTMPTSLLPMVPVAVIGMPEKPCRILASRTSPTVCEGLRTTGSVMKPCSNFCRQKKRAARNPEVA